MNNPSGIKINKLNLKQPAARGFNADRRKIGLDSDGAQLIKQIGMRFIESSRSLLIETIKELLIIAKILNLDYS